jgi:hypothetical protein
MFANVRCSLKCSLVVKVGPARLHIDNPYISAGWVKSLCKLRFRSVFLRAWKHWGNILPALSPLAAIETTREFKHTRRSLVRKFVGKKPTVREAILLTHAARCMTKAYFASADPSTSPDMQSKLNSSVRDALEALKLVAAERPRPRRNPNGVRLLTAEDLRL